MDSDLKSLIGKTIVFTEAVSKTDMDWFPGQLATVLNAEMPESDWPVWHLYLDFSDFEEHNKPLAAPAYYDSEHRPTLKFHETAYYPKDRKTTEYIDLDPAWWPFEVIPKDYTEKELRRLLSVSADKAAAIQHIRECLTKLEGELVHAG